MTECDLETLKALIQSLEECTTHETQVLFVQMVCDLISIYTTPTYTLTRSI